MFFNSLSHHTIWCIKGRTIRKVMGGGGIFYEAIFLFCTPIEEIYFFSHLMAGNIFFK